MKKFLLVIFLSLLLSSCSNNEWLKQLSIIDKKNIKEDKFIKTNDFLTWTEVYKKDLKIKKEKLKQELNNIEKEQINEEENQKKINNVNVIDYSRVNIRNITRDKLLNKIEDKYIFIDLKYEKSHKKLEKILNIIDILSKEWKIDSFELHCKNLNFNSNELNILSNLNIKTFLLEDMCWFKKDNFSWTWYNKQKVIDFLKKSKNIEELYVWYISMDLYKKENWEIKVYKDQ